MVYIFGVDIPVLEFLLFLNIIMLVYVIIILVMLWELKKVRKSLVIAGEKILEDDVNATLVLWTHEKLKAGVSEEKIRKALIEARFTQIDEIIKKAKAIH
jgi:hypothetical protein